jgi:hypothetical protein
MPSALIVAGDPSGPQRPNPATHLTLDELHVMVQSSAAKCRDMDPSAFHPDPAPGKRLVSHRFLEAQAEVLCAGCPIISACLEYALRREARANNCSGIWGGTAPGTRKAMIRTRREETRS